MTFNLRKIFLGCVLSAALLGGTSCSSYKSTLYMQNDFILEYENVPQLYDFRIMPKDELTIIISTTDPEASAPFTRKLGQSKEGGSSNAGMQNADLLNYLVDNEGFIDFPVLGMVKVMGMTARECEAHFRELLKPYLKEVPNVTVRTSNYKFSVLGEVNSPGTYSVDAEKVTIFEALAQAGDMTLFSVRDDVKLLREDSTGARRVYHLDLTSSEIVNSPYFYLQQNDVLYVQPTKSKVRSNTFSTNASMWLTLLSLVTSITTFVIALTK